MKKRNKLSEKDRIAALIREAITSGKIRPNERLIENDLSKRFNVSRTPIRGAIKLLEESGWAKNEKNRGAVVIAISNKEVAELFSVRAVLESYAANEACQNITADDLLKIEEIHAQMKSCNSDDNNTLRNLNMQFHNELCSLSRNTVLINLIKDLWNRTQFFRQSVWYPPDRWQKSIKDHDQIIDCIRTRDKIGISKLMLHHINFSAGLIDEVERIYGK